MAGIMAVASCLRVTVNAFLHASVQLAWKLGAKIYLCHVPQTISFLQIVNQAGSLENIFTVLYIQELSPVVLFDER